MKRINGFIDLNELLGIQEIEDEDLKDFAKRIKSNPHIEIVDMSGMTNQIIIKFNYECEIYYFKYDSLTIPYTELVLEELAKSFKIENISYDLAKIGRFSGVVSKNFKLENAKYISGRDILLEFYNKPDPNVPYESTRLFRNINDYNTLEGIWAALENRYKNQEVVHKIMEKLVIRFLFKIFTGDPDYYVDNWMIVEYSDGQVDLTPNFDNARCLLSSPYETFSSMNVDNSEEDSLNIIISKFLKISSNEFSVLVEDCFNHLNEENISEILKRVEEKIGCQIPSYAKKKYLQRFLEYREYFKEENGLKML